MSLPRKNRNLIAMISIFCLSGCSVKQPEPKTEDKPETAVSNVVKLSPDSMKQIAVKTITIVPKVAHDDIFTTGQIQPDDNRVFHINSLAPGRVIDDRAILGDMIKQGQVLAIIENLEVAKIYADFIRRFHENDVEIKDAETRFELTKSNLVRTQQLYDESIAPQKALIQAQTEFTLAKRAVEGLREKSTHIEEEARSLLAAYGVTLHNIRSEKLQTTSPIVSPRGGVITKKIITVGDVVAVQQTLYEVADLSQVWLDITIYDKDLPRVKEGQLATFVSDSLPEKSFSGPITYIRPSTSDNSRTFLARIALKNPRLLLKPGMFGKVTIQEMALGGQIFVPAEAVQNYGKENFVFLDLGGSRYQKQLITLGKKTEGGFVVDSGLSPGQRVVTQGAFNLKAIVLKSNFAEED